MSRLRLAREIADKTGTGVGKAYRFIGDVGSATARRSLRAAENGVTWRLPATVGVGTGGVLYWREQNIRAEEAIADQTGNTADALETLVNDDSLPPELRAELAEAIADGADGGGDGASNPFADLFGDGGLQETIIMLVVVLFVLNFALNYAGSMGANVGTGAGGAR